MNRVTFRPSCRHALSALATLILPLAAGPAAVAADAELYDLVARNDLEGLEARGPQFMEELVQLYERSDQDKRAEIAWVFYRLGRKSEEARRVLMRDVRTEHRWLRIAAQYALGRVSNDDQVVDILLENMMRDDKFLFRDKAACSLAYDQIHLTEAQKVKLYLRLIRALESPDHITRALTIQILEVHTGQRKGYDPSAPPESLSAAAQVWWRWLAEYRENVL